MKKGIALLLSLSMVCMMSGCSQGNQPAPGGGNSGSSEPVENSGKTYTWKLGTIYNDPSAKPEYNSFGIATQEFCDLVKEKSNGQLIVEPYYSSVLGASSELWGSLRDNEIQVFYGQPMSTADARFGVWNVPYLFSDYDEVEKMIASPDAPLFQQAQEWMTEDGVHLVAIGTSVFRGFFNIKHEVGAVSDLRDLKCRTYEDKVVNTFWSDICNATSMPFSEVYTGMQTGAVDGLEFAATSVLSSKYYEIADPSYYTDIDWQWTSGCNLVVSQEAWDELPDDLKEIVNECAWAAQDKFREEEEKGGEQALKDLASHGTVIRELTDEERQGWIDYARSLDDKMKAEIGEDIWNEVWDVLSNGKN